MTLTHSGYCNYIVEIMLNGGINCNNLHKKMEHHFAEMAPAWMGIFLFFKFKVIDPSGLFFEMVHNDKI
jgi:hypothetical protein